MEDKRVQNIEEFLLNPEETMFKAITDITEAIQTLQNAYEGLSVEELETLQGQDGHTPERGVDYMTQEDLQLIEEFITERLPQEGLDFPTVDQVQNFVRTAVQAIPLLQGEQGVQGEKGLDGKDGSPDTGEDIKGKIRTAGGLELGDIRGLPKKIKDLKELVDEFEELKERFDEIKIFIPAIEGGSGGGGVYTFSGSLNESGGVIRLVNDNAVPGNSRYYGTNSSGTKGFYPVPEDLSDLTDTNNIIPQGALASKDDVDISDINATGTPNSTKYLRGDGTWSTPAGGGSSYNFKNSLSESGGDVELDGDSATPGNSKYYGTNGSGVKGYHNLPGGGGGIDLTDLSATKPINYDDQTGKFTIDKADTSTDGYLDKTDWDTFNNKEPALPTGTASQYFKGDKTLGILDKSAVGLGNVDNTSDSTKNSATATLTNKQINKRVSTTASTASITPDYTSYDTYELTAQAVNFTLNLPSEDVSGQTITVRILASDDKTFTINGSYKSVDSLPSSLENGKRYEFIINQFNTGGSKEYWISGVEF